MKNKAKTIGGVSGGIAAAAAAVALVMTSTGGSSAEIKYEIIQKNEYVTEMRIDVPEELSADIAELDVNGAEVCKTLLPDGKFESAPIVFSALDNLEIKLYRLGKEIGKASFSGNSFKGEVSK